VATTRRPAANSSPQFIAGIVYRHVFGVVDGVDSLGVGQQQESWQRAPIYIFVCLVFYESKDVCTKAFIAAASVVHKSGIRSKE
jgi:hypothetical protein